MTLIDEPVSEMELDAYLNDQLDMAGRIRVEQWLAARPELAAQVMADLRVRDALRLAAREQATTRAGSVAAAERLGRGLTRVPLMRGLRHAAVALGCVALGWLAARGEVGEAAGPVPHHVQEAVQAHRAAMLRAAMPSQPEAPDLDRSEMLAATGIALPEWPVAWRILDAQLFPATHGMSVLLVFRTPRGGPFSLLVQHAEGQRGLRLAVPREGEPVAYWRQEGLGFALTGAADAGLLRDTAVSLAARLP
ncbi:anti-sigma factor family protein [Pseudoroseomonas globiformis]|uniref:Anti-sigma factor family protein n=1 Tax=Teichococcus globiformis TaxID=2307229 RepID=A0ABV7G2D1_9PROT